MPTFGHGTKGHSQGTSEGLNANSGVANYWSRLTDEAHLQPKTSHTLRTSARIAARNIAMLVLGTVEQQNNGSISQRFRRPGTLFA